MDSRARLHALIETCAFITSTHTPIVERRRGRVEESGWLFDIRSIALDPNFLQELTTAFWDTFKGRGIQIGGVETAAIPLITACVIEGPRSYGTQNVTGFYMRKSRKKDGLMKMIEGTIREHVPIVLVDDLMNSGGSLQRQVEVLESLGHQVTDVWTIIRFRDAAYYHYFATKQIQIHALFELNDFPTLGLKNLVAQEPRTLSDIYSIRWRFSSEKPSYQYVVPKSDPVIDEKRVYVGSDTGVMRALDQETGALVWEHRIGYHVQGKGIFSSPALFENTVFFGGYDGNVYALDANTGVQKWLSFEADWIGSSPAISQDLRTVFIGLEFGLWRKRGGIAALNVDTGKTIWRYAEMPCLTHASPLYIAEHHQVTIGSNDGSVYLFDARTGKLLWKTDTGVLLEAELNAGFSARDIKESIAYDSKRDLLIVATMDGSVYFLNRADGSIARSFKAEFGFYSTPVIFEDTVLVSSLDKHLYCLNLDTALEKWRWYAGARIFATPILINNHIYLGSNTGRLTKIDPRTGDEISFIQLTERITNRPAYNPDTHRLFVPTFANEIYCIEERVVSTS